MTVAWPELALGELDKAFLDLLQTHSGISRRIFQRDPSLWNIDASAARKLEQRLGWLDAPRSLQAEVPALATFAADLANEGYCRVLLLGMGEASLCPEMLRNVFGAAAGMLDVRVLDSTHPASVRAAEKWARAEKCAFLVASKSGTTTETVSLLRYFRAHFPRGKDFFAITDPETELHQQATREKFRHVFVLAPEVGGRFSALTFFGLVPAALLGIDLRRLLASAMRMIEACGESVEAAGHPAALLGLALGQAALAGRNKLTLLFSPRLRALGVWIEQLVAESTGKSGMGILPVDGEPEVSVDRVSEDRVFVATLLQGDENIPVKARIQALQAAGHPTIVLNLVDPLDLGGELVRWQMAAAMAAAVLGVDPFDEPDATETQEITRAVLEEFVRTGRLGEPPPTLRDGPIAACGDAGLTSARDLSALLNQHFGRAVPGDYLALLAYLPSTPDVQLRLKDLRRGLQQATGRAVTLGFGPRFQHSTGPLHKGGSNQGVFLQVIHEIDEDPEIPGMEYGFKTLLEAQALGDLQALQRCGRRFLRCRVHGDLMAGLGALQLAAAKVRARS